MPATHTCVIHLAKAFGNRTNPMRPRTVIGVARYVPRYCFWIDYIRESADRWCETDLPLALLGQIRRLLYERTGLAQKSRAMGMITCLMLLSSFRTDEASTNHVWG